MYSGTMARGFMTIEETAEYLGRRPSTIIAWMQQGKVEVRLYAVRGAKVRRVVACTEVDRLFNEEVPVKGSRPDHYAEVIHSKHVAHGKAGAAALARKKAQRLRSGSLAATTRNPPNDEEGKDPTK